MALSQTTFYTAPLRCNCPQCYSTNGLELRFQQKWIENPWYKKAIDEVTEQLHCSQCNDTIYPVNWTDDIELQHEYHKKKITTSNYFRLKAVSWIAVIVALLVIVGIIFFLLDPDLTGNFTPAD